MDARRESEPTPMKNRTTVERKSERELVVTRTFNGPARIVFEAWTKPELFKRWWVPKSMGMSLLSCEMDVRVGGRYRFVFGHGDSQTMAFFGTYLEVTPHSRLVWTNEESDDGCRHHGDLRGKRRQDAAGHARALSLEGSSRRCRHRGGGWDARDVRATGRASRHPGREIADRECSESRSAPDLAAEATPQDRATRSTAGSVAQYAFHSSARRMDARRLAGGEMLEKAGAVRLKPRLFRGPRATGKRGVRDLNPCERCERA